MQSSESVGSTFGRAWDLLLHNWILIVPGMFIGAFSALFLLSAPFLGYGSVSLTAFLAGIVILLAVLLTVAYTTGMAAAAWQTGRARLADGAHAVRGEGLNLFTAMLLVFVAGVLAIILALPTFFLSLLLFAMCVLYVFPSVIVRGNSAVAAFAESTALALHNWPVTLGVIVVLAIVSWLGRTLEDALTFIPLLGTLLGFVVQQVVAAYTTLVVVGEYLKLRPLESPAGPPGAS